MPTITSQTVARKLMDTMPMIWHAMSAAVRDGAVDDNNTMVQMHTLRALYEGPRSFKDLIAHRRVAPPTLSRSIETMVQRGWVERMTHPNDRRQVLLCLSDTGRREADAIDQRAQARLAELLEALSAAERKDIVAGMDALARAVHQLPTPLAGLKAVPAARDARRTAPGNRQSRRKD